ncbi:sensor histidine kinase [Nonomuraea sp. NPDC051941]|uniref:sensor histidine kinase n=1 Tax=Nonomuraea sp. NPDC051941 TaxID=3364373 RepID=UPI0037CAF0B5
MAMTMKPALGDILLAAVLIAITIATMAWHITAPLPAYVLAVLTAAPVALRQVTPVLTMVIIGAALAVYILVGYGMFPNAGMGLLVGLFTVTTLRPRPVAAAAVLGTVALIVLSYATRPGPFQWPDFFQDNLLVAGAWVLADSTRRWGERTRRLAEEATRAAANERVRIARELHDVVAHHMSVISLQAGVAGYVLDTDLPTARTAITTVSDATREALIEMRRLLDVLRVDPSGGLDVSPQPGLALLGELVDRTRAAGLPVEVVITGAPRPLPPGTDLCAYRILQESLTNALKHAGPASARVEVGYGERTLTLRVSDDGHPGHREPANVSGSHGIRGMRERAELYGGVLTAGPAEEGGFHVVARLPMADVP